MDRWHYRPEEKHVILIYVIDSLECSSDAYDLFSLKV